MIGKAKKQINGNWILVLKAYQHFEAQKLDVHQKKAQTLKDANSAVPRNATHFTNPPLASNSR